MARRTLRDDQWERIKDLLPGKASDCGATAKDNRLFAEAVLWIGRTGAPRRDLPPEFGNWHSTFVRFSRWADKRVWGRMFQVLSEDKDLEEVMLDSTVVSAHQHAAGAKINTARRLWAVLAEDSATNPCPRRRPRQPAGDPPTDGACADISEAAALLDQARGAGGLIADKGYDADALVQRIEAGGAEANIPSRCHRHTARDYDRHRYEERNLAERFFNVLKHFRRIATRYEKLDLNFLVMVICRCIMLWLK